MTLPHLHPDLPLDESAPPSDATCARAVVQRVRWATGLSQDRFAQRFEIDAAALEALEAGRTLPDSAMLAYLKVIERAPETVLEALSATG